MPNRHKWHIVVVPEDDATRQLGNGLSNAFPAIATRIKFLREAGGWTDAVATIKDLELDKYPNRRVLLIIDLDQDDTRLKFIRSQPEISKFNNRIFILGSFIAAEYAPPENFPVTEPDKPRIVDRNRVRAALPPHCMPAIADFATGPEILESGRSHENI